MQATRKSSFEHAHGILTNDVLGPGDRIGGNRHPARERFELHNAERVGPAREHEDVGARQVGRQHLLVEQSEEFGVGEPPPQLGLLRTLPDHDLRSRQVEREERRQVLLDGDASDAGKDRPRQAEVDGALGLEQLGVDAARPHVEILEAALLEARRSARA